MKRFIRIDFVAILGLAVTLSGLTAPLARAYFG